MLSSCKSQCRFAVFACGHWRKVLFWNIDHCILCWLCSWARCWMLQEMDHMEGRCVVYVMVGTLDQPEQNTIYILTVTSLGIARLTVHHHWMFSLCFMEDPRDVLRQTSPDIISIEELSLYILQTWDFSSCSPQIIPLNTQTSSDQLTANRGLIRHLCNLQRNAARFVLSRMFKLDVSHSI